MIYVTDDNALLFMLRYRDLIFPGKPIVFCGVNDMSFKGKNLTKNLYGTFESKDIAGNLELINELFPQTETVYFVGDDSPTYQAIYRQILASAATKLPQYTLSFIANRDIQQVKHLLRASSATVIVLTTMGGFVDEKKNHLSIKSALKQIREIGDFAIISTEDVYMVDGVLGGIVTRGKSQGEAAGEIGVQVLLNKTPKIQDLIVGSNIPTFNYNELKRKNLTISQLPKETVILNQPTSIIQEYRKTVYSTLFVFSILCALILYLILTITKKREAQKDLWASRNYLNSVLEHIPDKVFVKKAEDLSFVMVNKAAAEYLGSPVDEIPGKNVYDFFTKKDADFFTKKDHEALKNMDLLDIPVESVQTRDGNRYIHTKKTPLLGEDGKPELLLGISRDVTEEHISIREKLQLQSKLRQSQKMEAIGTLAGGIAHDFNNILSSIIGYTELAQIQKDVPEKIAKYLDGTRKGAERAKQLVRQILTFSRKNEQNLTLVDLSDVIHESLGFLQSSLPSSIEIIEDIEPTQNILADPTQVHQVVMNLCTNGYHSMQETGGTLKIGLREIQVSKEITGPIPGLKEGFYAFLFVKDSGKGMEQEVAEQIFDPYFTTKGPEAGTGLGLSVVHGIITSHKGSIDVDSEPGVGTVVKVCIPLADISSNSNNAKKESTKINEKGKGERILLVDDESEILAITENLFNFYGYHVTAFNNSNEALQAFIEHKEDFDLIITDMTMPGLTGAELATKILEITPDIPIILCTGYSKNIDREKAKSIGIKGYCEKPVPIEKLLSTIS